MKKIFFLSMLLGFSIFNFGQNLSDSFSKISKLSTDKNESLSGPWIAEVGMMYQMPIKAQIYKDGVLFQPTGIILGVFKNGKCYGQNEIGLSTGPGGIKYCNITMGWNTVNETGFICNVFDPNTNLIYNITETIEFKSLVSLGSLTAPTQLHISGLSAIQDTYETLFSVYPNPVVNEFSIKIGSESSKQASVELFNLAGGLVNQIYTGEVIENQVINVAKDDKCNPGIYLLTTKIGDKVNTKRLIFK